MTNQVEIDVDVLFAYNPDLDQGHNLPFIRQVVRELETLSCTRSRDYPLVYGTVARQAMGSPDTVGFLILECAKKLK